MKRSGFFKFLLTLTVVLTMVVIFSTFAPVGASVKLSYKHGGSTQDYLVEEGQTVSLITPEVEDDEIFYGWADRTGKIYNGGDSLTVTEKTTLFAIVGCEISTAEELFDAISKGVSYVKMTNNIIVTEQLVLDGNIFVIDTNGCTLTINTDASAISSTNTGVAIVGGGSVRHTSASFVTGLEMFGFVSLDKVSDPSSLFFTVDKNTSLYTNTNLFAITTNTSRLSSVFFASIHGSVECYMLMISNGISDGLITFHKTAQVTTHGEFLFEDRSNSTTEKNMSLKILGGNYNFDRLSGISRDKTEKYGFFIQGASTYAQDITGIFKEKNYSFVRDGKTGIYSFSKCEHDGPVISELPACGAQNATIESHCLLCDLVYTETVAGMQHDIITVVTQPMINTEEVTQELRYEKYCVRCGGERQTYVEYPDPSTVYVTVTYLDEKGRSHDIRVFSKYLYSFASASSNIKNVKYSANCELISFGTDILWSGEEYKNLNIKQENIVSVEIPLGTRIISGTEVTHANNGITRYSGVFYENSHLRQVVIPNSVTEIKMHAFREMAALTDIKGLEHVTGEIGKYAFYQTHQNVVIDQMVLNASKLGMFSFQNIRMNHLYIGANVGTIETGAFLIENPADHPEYIVKEVFIEGNTVNATTFKSAFKGKYYQTSQQFGDEIIVFLEHQVNSVVTEPDCVNKGYTTHTCKYCSYVRVDTETAALGHDPKEIVVPSTCSTQGYTVEMCERCGEEYGDRHDGQRTDPNNHVYDSTTGYVFYDEDLDAFVYYNSDKKAFFTKEGVQLDKEYYICEAIHYKVPVCVGKRCYSAPDWSNVPSDPEYWVTPSLIHQLNTSKRHVITEANCGEEGLAITPCKVCGKEVEEILPITGESHKWSSGVIIQAPTCTSQGIEEFRCTICTSDTSVRRRVLEKDPSNHSWNEGVVEREPTEAVSGILRISCVRAGCYASFTEGINRLPASEPELPTWAIICIIAGGVLLAAGVVLTLYFTFFKKKRASDNYTYKFNTFKK